jgi:hypothetical protein
VFNRLKLPVHDRLGPSQSGAERRISKHAHQSDQSSEPVRPIEQQDGLELMLQNSSAKGREKVEQSIPGGEDAENSVAKEVIKIGNNDVVMGDCFKGPVIINSSTRAQVSNNSGSSQP